MGHKSEGPEGVGVRVKVQKVWGGRVKVQKVKG